MFHRGWQAKVWIDKWGYASCDKGWHICCSDLPSPGDRLVGLMVKASASKMADPDFDSRFRRGSFARSSHTCDLKLVVQWHPCQVPGVIESVLGVVGPASVYCDQVR